MAVGHCVCLANCELSVNSGLISIVIVIVIGCHFMPLFFLKSGTLIFVLLGIIITDGCLHFAFVLPSFWVRSGFALATLLRVEAKGIQNGMKKTSTSPIRLSNDSFFSEQYQFRLFCAVFGSARMLLKAACERRGVHFSATLSEPSTGRFLHLRSGFALAPLLKVETKSVQNGMKKNSKKHIMSP